jgi:predicted AlkP superfamily phosphohydrolase/phosphomutase
MKVRPTRCGARDTVPRVEFLFRSVLPEIIVLLLIGAALLHGHSSPQGQYGHSRINLAYVGPGAGFAFLGSFLTVLISLFLGMVSLLLWPFRILKALITGKQGYKRAKVQKLIFLGLDGLDPKLLEQFMAAGKLPNFSRLKEQGGFRRLRTTFPPLSPVAWSTFATGVNPARHNMFDFLNRNLKSYMPELSSTRVNNPERVLKIGKYRIPLSRPVVEMRRKSRTFWHILGEHRIASTILRVPITFPPEKFNGRLLSAMCTPDLLGSQGTFAVFTTNASHAAMESGNQFPLSQNGKGYTGEIEGPRDYMVEEGGALKIPFALIPSGTDRATIEIGEDRLDLRAGEYTRWVTLTFHASLGIKVQGIARFLLTETEPAISLYMTPINIDPENPALPISHPSYYAAYLAKLLGVYSTLGMAEDTWALNEHAIDEDAFLRQAYLIYDEREAMFFSALERTKRGVVACVFDTTDRVQHMFFAQMGKNGAYSRIIEDLYCRADGLVGKTMKYIDKQTALVVLSDHGFTSFERGVNLNAWLLQNGYLTLKENAQGRDYLKDVDWDRTKAYTFGLAGIYINQKGRESKGVVESGAQSTALKDELARKLSGLRDEQLNRLGIRKAWTSNSLYTGPYLNAAPDIIVGYADGYRASWGAAVGRVTSEVFENNEKAWSGDHCVDPHLVPGVLLSNLKIDADDPGIEDMAPTALHLFGITPPPHMEGKSVLAVSAAMVESEVTA